MYSLMTCNDPFKAFQQKANVESVENFQGAFLTIHELQACSAEVNWPTNLSSVSYPSPNSTHLHPQLSSLANWTLRGFKNYIFAYFGLRDK